MAIAFPATDLHGDIIPNHVELWTVDVLARHSTECLADPSDHCSCDAEGFNSYISENESDIYDDLPQWYPSEAAAAAAADHILHVVKNWQVNDGKGHGNTTDLKRLVKLNSRVRSSPCHVDPIDPADIGEMTTEIKAEADRRGFRHPIILLHENDRVVADLDDIAQ